MGTDRFADYDNHRAIVYELHTEIAAHLDSLEWVPELDFQFNTDSSRNMFPWTHVYSVPPCKQFDSSCEIIWRFECVAISATKRWKEDGTYFEYATPDLINVIALAITTTLFGE